MSAKRKYTFIDLFSGLGGFHIALESLGCKCIFTPELKDEGIVARHIQAIRLPM
ncbi:MAG: DNA cytosine methyltransferase [Paludibacteraceae bacterium]